MKKQRFSKTIIFLIAITFFLFFNISQSNAQCNIIWWGGMSGYAPTNETSPTETATFEAFVAIFGIEPDECRSASLGYYCLAGVFLVYNDEGSIGIARYGAYDYDGYWDVVCADTCEAPGVDSDVDGICDDGDNCPDVANHLQDDADSDGIGDACDDDTIYGYVHGNVYDGVTIHIVETDTQNPVATLTTEESGYYAIGNLDNGSYTVFPQDVAYTFDPGNITIQIPQIEPQSYNFTSTEIIDEVLISGTVSGDSQEGVTIALSGYSTGKTITDSNGNYSFSIAKNLTQSQSYTIKPTKTDYVFSPRTQDVTLSSSDKTGVDFISYEVECNIIWWGDESGYIPTFESEVTQNAAYDAFIGIFGYVPSVCESNGCSNSTSTDYVQLNPNFWSSEYGPPYGNGWGIVCTDQCELSGGDSDVDRICDDADNCISTPNHLQEDLDSDGIGDVCDNCLSICNSDQLDADNDTIGDVCDPEPGCGSGCGQPACEQPCVSCGS